MRAASIAHLAGLGDTLRLRMLLKEADGKIVKNEERAVGSVQRSIYMRYL
jgi:hypothetical protein